MTDPFEAPDGRRALHHVTRLDIGPTPRHPHRHPTHGWQVRVRTGGARPSRFFADARHGGREAALAAALAFRDSLLAMSASSDATPRKAWSNTGVVGLSVRDRADGSALVHANWTDAEGKRRTASFSVEKWGLRRALWNACLRLYREKEEAGAPVEEPHVMFARAQEPFAEQIREEIEREQAAEKAAASPTAEFSERRTEANREQFESPEAKMQREEERLRDIERALFG